MASEDDFTHVSQSDSGCEGSLPMGKQNPFYQPTNKADRLRTALRQRILDDRNYRKPLTILLVGPAGVGKSSFLNSVLRANLNRWGNWILTGSGEGRANITAILRRIHIYDPLIDDPERLSPEEMEEDSNSDGEEEEEDHVDMKRMNKMRREEKILKKMAPRIIDVCGLPNDNFFVTREVLRLLIYGHIPSTDNVLEARSIGDKEGAAALRQKYPTPDPELAVDRVVFVAAANQEVPKELIQAVMDVAQPLTEAVDRDVIARKAVPVFGLITKYDLTKKMDDAEIAQFEQRKAKFIEALALKGDEVRYCECENYVNRQDEIPDVEHRTNNPQIDAKILSFLYDVCGRDFFIAHPRARLEFKQSGEPTTPPHQVPAPQTEHPANQTDVAQPQQPPTAVDGYPGQMGNPAAGRLEDRQAIGLGAVSGIVVALAIYIGVLLHYNVLANICNAHPAGVIPAGLLVFTPLIFLLYVTLSNRLG